MTEYICYNCGYFTKIRTHYHRHLATKKHIKNTNHNLEKGINDCLHTAQITQNNAQIAKKGIKMANFNAQITQNNAQMSTNQKYTFFSTCEYCNRSFTRIDTKTRHQNKYCKAKKKKI